MQRRLWTMMATSLLAMMAWGATPPLTSMNVQNLSSTLAKPDAEMDGAAVVALTAAMSANLCSKVAGLNLKHQVPGPQWTLLQQHAYEQNQALLVLMQKDADHFEAYLGNQQNPTFQLQVVQTPYAMMQGAYQVMLIAAAELPATKTWLREDVLTAIQLSHAALMSAGYIAQSDLSLLSNKSLSEQYRQKIARLTQQGQALYRQLLPRQ